MLPTIKISFHSKLFLALGMVVCLSMVTVLLAVQETTKRQIQENIEKRFSNTLVALRHLQKVRTQFAIDTIDTLMNYNAHFRSILSTASVAQDTLGFDEVDDEDDVFRDANLRLASILPFLSFYAHADIFITTNADGVLLYSKQFPDKYGVDLAHLHVFKELSKKAVAAKIWSSDMANKQAWLLPLKETKSLYYIIAKPVVFGDEIHGVVIYGTRIDKKELLSLKNISGVEIALYTNGGIQSSTLSLEIEKGLARFVKKYSGHVEQSKIFDAVLETEDFLLTNFPILRGSKIRGQGFIVMKSLTQEMKFLSTLRIAFAMTGAAILLIAVGISYLLAKGITRPLMTLEKAAGKIRDGPLDTHVNISTGDELENLGRAFNDMAGGLREKAFIEDAFGKYVDPQVKDEVLAGKVPLDGEQKEVTILFSDLRNFTNMIEQQDSKKSVMIMNRYFKEMAGAIHLNNGHVLQFIGDEIYAVFGAPISSPHHYSNAVKAALSMMDKLSALNMEFKKKGWPVLKHGIGVHSGMAVAANIGSPDRMSYLLVGNTVNTASRLQSLNKETGTELIISEATFKKLESKDETKLLFKQLPSRKLKGLTEPVGLYTLKQA